MKTIQRILIIGSFLALHANAMGCGVGKEAKQIKGSPTANEVYGPPAPQVLVREEKKAQPKRTLTSQFDPLQNSESEFVSR